MAWLAIHMWLLLLGAFFLGLWVGRWIWHGKKITTPDSATVLPPVNDETQQFFDDPHRDVTSAVSKETDAPSEAPDEGGADVNPVSLVQTTLEKPADDLKKIKGIGPGIEKLLNELGVWRFEQIAGWDEVEIARIDTKLQFPGRITRENWVEQATVLQDGGETEFASRYTAGKTPSSYKNETARNKKDLPDGVE